MTKIKQTLNKWRPFAALPIILFACLWLWSNLSEDRPISMYSSSGTWDLRGINFDDAYASLHGPVKSISGLIFSSDEFAALEDEASLVHPHIGNNPSTVRVRILVSEDEEYLISRFSTGYAEKIYVNGQWIRDIGSPGTHGADETLLSTTITFAARPINGVIEILHSQSNFIYHVHGVYGDGTPNALNEYNYGNIIQKANITTGVLLGIFLSLAIISLLLFFQFKYTPALLFSLTCLIYFFYVGGTGTKAFVTILPWYTDSLRLRIMQSVLPLVTVFILTIAKNVFPGVFNKYFVNGAITVFSAWALLIMLGNMEFNVGYALWIGMCMSFICSLYFFFGCLTKMRNMNAPQAIFVIGMAFYLYTTVRDFFTYVPITVFDNFAIRIPPYDGANFTRIGMIAFLFCQAITIFTTTVNEMEKAKENERQLSAKNAMLDNMYRMKTEFLTNISHEMKTPLTIMSGYAELTEWQINEDTNSKDLRDNLLLITEEAHRLAQFVERLLGVYGAEDIITGIAKTSVPDVLNRVQILCKPILTTNKNKLSIEVDEKCSFVAANSSMLLQVFVNLVSNANRHTNNDTIKITAKRTNDNVLFSVRDNGSGISPELLENIFQRGYSSHSGTGIGLSICKETVETHGGTIQVESELGKGTTITFTLPVYKENKEGEV